MIIILIIAAYFSLSACINSRAKREKAKAEESRARAIKTAQAEKEAERAEAKRQREEERERKTTAARQQAEADIIFFVEQIDKLYNFLREADAELNKARLTCIHDNECNQHGAVISEKEAAKHRAERDKLEKKVMQLERNIHSYESKLYKAQQIAENN